MANEQGADGARTPAQSPKDDLTQAQEIKAQGERLLEESRALQEDSKALLDELGRRR